MSMEKDKVVVTGGTGLVGREVTKVLRKAGMEVTVMTRSARRPAGNGMRYVEWDGRAVEPLAEALRGARAVVHLAGENVGQRWTEAARTRIMQSRLEGGQAVKAAVESLPEGERPVVVAASAIGWYADSPEWQAEGDVRGAGFLADVVEAWEGALVGVATRCVTLRIGVVLSRGGGALGKLEPLFRWGLGSAVGPGTQWQSWIHVRDLAQLVLHAVETDQMQGVYNAVAPNPVTNRTLARELARAMRRPCWLPAPPAAVLRLVLGDMARITLDSQRIRSNRLAHTGFKFEFSELRTALADLYS